jgi:hypothetical protein
MNWTTEYPTKPGYYWIRKYQIQGWHNPGSTLGPDIVQVWPDLDFDRIGDDRGYNKRNIISAEWYGPIEPPTEDTQPTEGEEEYCCGYNTVSGAFHKPGCTGECGFMNPGDAIMRRRIQRRKAKH